MESELTADFCGHCYNDWPCTCEDRQHYCGKCTCPIGECECKKEAPETDI